MAEHVTLADPFLHEPKDVAFATVDTVYVADGAGSGTWEAAPLTIETGHIGIHFTGNVVETVISIVNTPVQINTNNTAALFTSDLFTVSADGTMTYTGATTRLFTVMFNITCSTAAAAVTTFNFYAAKNNVPESVSILPTEIITGLGNGSTVTMSHLMSLATGDTIRCFVENITDIENITIKTFRGVIV